VAGGETRTIDPARPPDAVEPDAVEPAISAAEGRAVCSSASKMARSAMR
jgi:hypothetical protein